MSTSVIRPEIAALASIGAFPATQDVVIPMLEKQEDLLRRIAPPLTDDEARLLVTIFGPDDYFGAAWTVLHLVESAPGWPLYDCLANVSNEWIARLQKRVT